MNTRVVLEVGDLSHTWDIPVDLTPAEKNQVLQALCQLGRSLQLIIISSRPSEPGTPYRSEGR
jgi:hypothetical protein